MERKQFLIYATTATGLLPLLLTEIACDSYGGDSVTASSNEDGFTKSSSSNNGHTHSVTIRFSDVNAPPAGGRTHTTSRVSHTHTLTLSQADFQALGSGDTITRSTSTDASHSHTFTIKVPDASSALGDDGGDDTGY